MSDMYKRIPQTLTGPGGNQPELRVKYIDNGDGTWSMAVGALVLPLPSGAATSAKQDTTNVKLDDLIAAVGLIGATPATTKLIDDTTTAGMTYIGSALLTGAAVSENSSNWKIKRIDETGAYPKIKYADGNANYDNNWTNRVGLTYV